MSVSQSDVVNYIKNIKLGKVRGLVSTLEGELGVKATAPVRTVPPPDRTEIEVEQTEFNVVLRNAGDARVKVIKAVRVATGLGLKESKALVEGADALVREGVDRDTAETLAAELRELGAVVDIV